MSRYLCLHHHFQNGAQRIFFKNMNIKHITLLFHLRSLIIEISHQIFSSIKLSFASRLIRIKYFISKLKFYINGSLVLFLDIRGTLELDFFKCSSQILVQSHYIVCSQCLLSRDYTCFSCDVQCVLHIKIFRRKGKYKSDVALKQITHNLFFKGFTSVSNLQKHHFTC